MDIKIIMIIILVVVIIGLVVVGFVPFGGKLLLCSSNTSNIVSASNTSNIVSASNCGIRVSASNCGIMGYISKSSCPSVSEQNPESYYDEKWCKSKYVSISTESQYCQNISSNITNLVSNIAVMFGPEHRLIKEVGTTTSYYYDPAGTTIKPSPTTESATFLSTWVTVAKKKTPTELLNLFKQDKNMMKFPLNEFRSGITSQLSVNLGLNTNDYYVTYDLADFRIGPGKLTTPKKYNLFPNLWQDIGVINGKTYYYLNLTDDNKKVVIDDLKAPSISKYSEYCV
jgi:hypothetical protein